MNIYINISFAGITSKENENIDDCQDAFQAKENCIAIADGASQSLYPKVWAELLVENFCNNPNNIEKNWQLWLEPIQEKWLQIVTERIENARKTNNPTWISNQNRLNQFISAKSTFIGLQIKNNQMHISMIGDSCLFIWQDNKLEECIPYNSSSEFNDSPIFFAGFKKDNKFKPSFYKKDIDKIKKTFYVLATDALSEWILKNIEAKKEILSRLQSIKNQKDFENLLSDARNSKEIKLKNDDVTLICFELLETKNETLTIPETSQEGEIAIQKDSQNDSTTNDLADEKKEKAVTIKNVIAENKKLQRKNKRLKISLLAVTILAVILILIPRLFQNQAVVATPPIANKQTLAETSEATEVAPSAPKSIQLPKGTIIYSKENKDVEQLKTGLNTNFDVVILEEDDNWIKFEIDLFVAKNKIKEDENEITINKDVNIRIIPSTENNTPFGNMDVKTRFYKIQNDNNNWVKFKFIGYSKKEE